MTMNRIRLGIGAYLLAFSPLLLGAPAKPPSTTTESAVASPSVPSGRQLDDYDSRETRDKFRELMHTYPPEVAMVLKLDPSLFTNATYLASYPGLAAFVGAHPEIAHAPDFYLSSVTLPNDTRQEVLNEHVLRVLEGVSGLLIFLIFTVTLIWVVKTLVEHRRWSRQSKVQTEVHSKLLDRMTSSADLIAYAQTAAGKRFLEGAPIALDAASSAISAPIGRFLWSIQAGVVLAAGGFGLEIVSGQMPNEIAPVVSGIGILVLSVGVGFVISAIVSFVLARKLGLVPAKPVPPVDEPERG
jgi:hypothetical protein